MYTEKLPEVLKTTTMVKIKYDCCGKLHELKWKDADKNYQKNGNKHICRPCWLKNDNPSTRQEVLDKMKKTCLERYGVTCALNTEENTKSRVESMFGTEERVEEIVAKRKQTSLERYGTESPMQNEEIKAKQHAVMMEKYGVDVPLKNPEILAKMRATIEERYGVSNVMEIPEIQEKMALTTFERHGVEYYNQLPEMKDYLRENCVEWLSESYAIGGPMKGITRPQEWNDKQRETVAQKIEEGTWYSGDKNSLKGTYQADKCGRQKPWFRSSYELIVHWYLDHCEDVEWYDYEPFQVSYYDEIGHKRYYTVDFSIKFKSLEKLVAIEVKNNYTKDSVVTQLKKSAFNEQCGECFMPIEVWANKEIKKLNLNIDELLKNERITLM